MPKQIRNSIIPNPSKNSKTFLLIRSAEFFLMREIVNILIKKASMGKKTAKNFGIKSLLR